MSAPACSASSTSLRLCASTSVGSPGVDAAHPRHRVHHTAGEADVVVLDQNAVVQAEAMVAAAAGAHGVLLQRAQQRCRLARVEDRDASRRGIDELPRQRGDAGQPLHEVERGAFRRQQRRGMPANLGDHGARLTQRAPSRVTDADGDGRIELPERFRGDVEPGDDAARFGQEHGARLLRRDRRSPRW